MSKSKVVVRKSGLDVFDGLGDLDIRELGVVRYMGASLKRFNGDVDRSLGVVSEVFGISRSECRVIWERRDTVLSALDGRFELSGDVLRGRLRALYLRLVDDLLGRNFGSENVKVILEGLKVIAQLEVAFGVTGVFGEERESDLGNNVGVRVTRSQVIVVPMPSSARESTREVGDRVVTEAGFEGQSRRFYDSKRAERAERVKFEEVSPEVEDVLEELKETERTMRRRVEESSG